MYKESATQSVQSTPSPSSPKTSTPTSPKSPKSGSSSPGSGCKPGCKHCKENHQEDGEIVSSPKIAELLHSISKIDWDNFDSSFGSDKK